MPKTTPRPPEPTAEQLRLAWRHLARPGWPDTLAAALQHPTYGVCIRGLARQLGRAQPCVPAPVRHSGAYVPPTPTAPRTTTSAAQALAARLARSAGTHDPRRLAAGDRDED